MKQLLEDIVREYGDYMELRFHRRLSNSFKATKGRVDVANHTFTAGVGVRVLVKGIWGFAATTDVSKSGIRRAVERAQACAKSLAKTKLRHNVKIRSGKLARFDYEAGGYRELLDMKTSDKLARVVETEQQLAKQSSRIHTASCRYNELLEEKIIVTTDGASALQRICQPEFSVSAIASKDGEQIASSKGAGVAGGWNCLFKHPTLEGMIEETAKLSVDLLAAKYPEGGMKNVILDPAVVGLLCHEAIGHTVEADFVKAGSVAQGKIGATVASPLVTMVDSGCESFTGYATGNIPFDDEGVVSETTTIIEKGKLVSYLHNKESAHEFDAQPTGSARAWQYDDEPLIRMRNTYIVPGKDSLSEMIASIDDGYLVEGAGSGQADSNGEFMFGCSHVWHIKNGKKNELLREATLSGIAFDVLKTVDAVSKEFRWDLGTGHCGKGQPAKVDAGGPYIKCKIHVGGRT